MTHQVDLIWLETTDKKIDWPLGTIHAVQPTPEAVHKLTLRELPKSDAKAWLFWRPSCGLPDPERVSSILVTPGNLWHAGLKLGAGGLPNIIDFVDPIWTLNRDPDSDIEATSWRVSLDACLVLTDVLQQMGGIQPDFQTLPAAALELGHRYIRNGVFLRHVPQLLPTLSDSSPIQILLEDELLFLQYRYSGWKYQWAIFRAIMSGYATPLTALRTGNPISPRPAANIVVFDHPCKDKPASVLDSCRVTVLIPTIERYSYLRTLLHQLRDQEVAPFEIIVVDQTESERRDTRLEYDFSDLPLQVIYLDQAGQCTSRNEGLLRSQGDYILFLDDDVEIDDDLIQKHLVNLHYFNVDVSSGVVKEVDAGTVPVHFPFLRISDVFPTSNSMIRREVLHQSGLFDLAYDRGQRADGDLGMRIYLSGAFMIVDPNISLLHHHAPRGGLRIHKARVVTRAISRRSLTKRRLPSVSEIYLMKRYFTARQLRESLWMSTLGTFRIQGVLIKRITKALISLLLLPDTLWRLYRRRAKAAKMLNYFPQFPELHQD